MTTRISERERLLAYSYTADREELEAAVDIFRTALRTRFAPARRKGASRDRGTKRPSPAKDADNTTTGDSSGERALAAR